MKKMNQWRQFKHQQKKAMMKKMMTRVKTFLFLRDFGSLFFFYLPDPKSCFIVKL